MGNCWRTTSAAVTRRLLKPLCVGMDRWCGASAAVSLATTTTPKTPSKPRPSVRPQGGVHRLKGVARQLALWAGTPDGVEGEGDNRQTKLARKAGDGDARTSRGGTRRLA